MSFPVAAPYSERAKSHNVDIGPLLLNVCNGSEEDLNRWVCFGWKADLRSAGGRKA